MALGNFLAELKRRHVYRAGGAYAVAAFGLIEIVSNVTPMLDLPAWIGRALILILIVGFPLTLFAAWMIEGKSAEGAPAPSTSKLDFVLAGALVLVVGLLIYQQVGPAPQKTAAGVTSAEGISIAVLPFLNLSRDPEQEFFSDGMTEEITSALAKVQSLRVVGRTSAFKFKGQNDDLRSIGKALSASHILEGSVRKEGNQIRVTAQLIRADDGTHIWTDNYDRELKSVFAIQDDIAQAIAGALRMPLGLKTGETLVSSQAIDPESHQEYLQAKALFRARGTDQRPLAKAIVILEQTVARDPGYAAAWSLLAQVYANAPQEDPNRPPRGSLEEYRRIVDVDLSKAEAAGRRAIALDPRSADSYAGAANPLVFRGRYVEVMDLYRQALKLDPFNPDALHGLSQQLAGLGRGKEALPLRQQLILLDPLVPRFNFDSASILWFNGQTEAALAMAKALPADYLNRGGLLASIYASTGRFNEAADAMLTAAQFFPPGEAEAAARLLRQAPAVVAPQDLPDLRGGQGVAFVYLYVGAAKRLADTAFDIPERSLEAGYQITNRPLWSAAFKPVRQTERFKAYARKAGWVDYWRARGWPDVCRPVGADDFVCD